MFARIKAFVEKLILSRVPEYKFYKTVTHNVVVGKNSKLYYPVRLYDVRVGDYSYVGMYSHLKNVTIGKFCSIGPQCIFGWGVHPIDGISTSPMFYSTQKQNGVSLSPVDKIVEQKPIVIGNDVFIGMNVTILDGVSIGDGAVIGAGAVVSKNIPPYAVAVGNPIRIIKYRFPDEIIRELNDLKWWDFTEKDLNLVERDFFNVTEFIAKAKNRK